MCWRNHSIARAITLKPRPRPLNVSAYPLYLGPRALNVFGVTTQSLAPSRSNPVRARSMRWLTRSIARAIRSNLVRKRSISRRTRSMSRAIRSIKVRERSMFRRTRSIDRAIRSILIRKRSMYLTYSLNVSRHPLYQGPRALNVLA